MELVALYKRVIGLDIHQAQITACALIEEPDGNVRIEQRQFGTFKKDRRELAQWVASLHPDEVVMESTGIYWKSPYAALEAVAFGPRWSMPGTSRMCRVARPMWAMPIGWQPWHARDCCAARSCRRPNSVSCA